jgi:hypothetical protein
MLFWGRWHWALLNCGFTVGIWTLAWLYIITIPIILYGTFFPALNISNVVMVWKFYQLQVMEICANSGQWMSSSFQNLIIPNLTGYSMFMLQIVTSHIGELRGSVLDWTGLGTYGAEWGYVHSKESTVRICHMQLIVSEIETGSVFYLKSIHTLRCTWGIHTWSNLNISSVNEDIVTVLFYSLNKYSMGHETLSSIKGREFLDQLSNCQILKDSSQWS